MRVKGFPLPLSQEKTPELQKEKLREVAKMYEKHFLNEMLKSMRSTVPESGLINKNQAEKIFQEQLDGQYAESWGAQGGLGFADLIYDQLIDKFGAQMGISQPLDKPMGPLPLGEKDIWPQVTSNSSQDLNIFYSLGNTKKTFEKLLAPWSGSIESLSGLEDGKSLLGLKFDNGLKSRIYFEGKSLLGLGQGFQAGDAIGKLNSQSSFVSWKINSLPEEGLGDGENPF